MRHNWTPKEDRALKTLFPHMQTQDVARILGRSVSSINNRANFNGLRKSDAYNASPLSGRIVKGNVMYGSQSRFKKGNAAWNKGMKGLRTGGESGWFKTGQVSARWKPEDYLIGSLRLSKDGIVEMKVAERGRWKSFHVCLWEDVNGPVPQGHCVIFKDRDRLNIDIENLELVTRAENMRRNSIHRRLPKTLVHTVMILGQLKRRIREADDRRTAR